MDAKERRLAAHFSRKPEGGIRYPLPTEEYDKRVQRIEESVRQALHSAWNRILSIDGVIIYGSWARRNHPYGPEENSDVDLLIYQKNFSLFNSTNIAQSLINEKLRANGIPNEATVFCYVYPGDLKHIRDGNFELTENGYLLITKE